MPAETPNKEEEPGPDPGSDVPGRAGLFAGGCTIIGLPTANSWSFYYQVYGTVDYTRPDIHLAKAIVTFKWHYTHKKIWKGLEHGAGYSDVKVHGWGQIYWESGRVQISSRPSSRPDRSILSLRATA